MITALLGDAVAVIGESMGGALTALLTVEFPTLIDRVVLCAPCFRIANRFAWVTTLALTRRFMPTTNLGAVPDWMRPYWYAEIPTGAVAKLVYVARKARKTASGITLPILVIQAKDDRMVQYRGALSFFRGLGRLKGSDKQLKILERGHHNLTIDLNPEKQQVFQWVREFLGGLV
jgi:esterase/lipase